MSKIDRKIKKIKKRFYNKQEKRVSSFPIGSLLFSKTNSFSFSKNEDAIINEDSAKNADSFIAISDGAGGGGVFADRWSNLLVEKLTETPLCTPSQLNEWIDSFVNVFYDECERLAQTKGGLFLDKFYEEGSYATLSAIWKVSENSCFWMMYGDSTAFCYNYKTKGLQCSQHSLANFDEPPYLLCTINQIQEKGFNTGTFACDENSILFVASDAVSHMLLMLYAVEHSDENVYAAMLRESLGMRTKTANFVRVAMDKKFSFEEVLDYLCSNVTLEQKQEFLYTKEMEGVLGHDDYSFAFAKM